VDTYKRQYDTSRPICSDSLNLMPPAPLYLWTLWRYKMLLLLSLLLLLLLLLISIVPIFTFKYSKFNKQIQLTDGFVYADNSVLYNKFDVKSSSYHRSQHPTSEKNCVVDTPGYWRAARCAEEHLTVCQSDSYIAPGKHFFSSTFCSTVFPHIFL